jgi:hypothetical protein
MGTILTDDVGGRDAVHVAVVSVTATGRLTPGQHIGFKGTPGDNAPAGIVDEPIGIVDPFLDAAVQAGQRFWLYLYPRTITSLRHNWTHPKFADAVAGQAYAPPSAKLASEQWLRTFIEHADCPGYEQVIGEAVRAADNGEEYVFFSGQDAHGDIPPEFWDHLAVVTGRKFDHRPEWFSCSC